MLPISVGKLCQDYAAQMAGQVLPGKAVGWLACAIEEATCPGTISRNLQYPNLTVANFAFANTHVPDSVMRCNLVEGFFIFTVRLERGNRPDVLLDVVSTPAEQPAVLTADIIMSPQGTWLPWSGSRERNRLAVRHVKQLNLQLNAEVLLLEVLASASPVNFFTARAA